ncbi:MAG: hypothetical protein R3C14_21000 [Caldilineaceae bacterium]
MNLENQTRDAQNLASWPPTVSEPPAPVNLQAELTVIRAQLDLQTKLLQQVAQELAVIRAAQSGQSETIGKLDRQLRFARWARRVNGLLFWLILVGAIGAALYYFVDWPNLLYDLFVNVVPYWV